MTQSLNELLADLEAAISEKDPLRHVRSLKGITSLFVTSADSLAESHVEVYDAVMQRLLSVVETDTRASVARVLASVPNAPRQAINMLARDHISVAAPVLAESPRLTDGDLVEIAREAGQQHLLAISGRKALATNVTDVLVVRGDRAVLRSTARNPGASFSDRGFGTLVQRSERDPTLQQVVGLRADLPAHHFKLLIEKAAKDVKALLLHRVGRENIGALDKLVQAAAVTLDEVTLSERRDYTAAVDAIARVAECGKLNEATIASLARSGKFEEVVCALSGVTKLPLDAVETALCADKNGGLILMVRAMNFTWSTVRLILRLRPQGPPARGDMEDLLREFQDMTPTTAKRALRFMVARDTNRVAMMAA
jgi:uncharacterized protein (DUF2336 family)